MEHPFVVGTELKEYKDVLVDQQADCYCWNSDSLYRRQYVNLATCGRKITKIDDTYISVSGWHNNRFKIAEILKDNWRNIMSSSNPWRFKTEEEFKTEGRWDSKKNCPGGWNDSGKMNKYMGQLVPKQHWVACEGRKGFHFDNWYFSPEDYTNKPLPEKLREKELSSAPKLDSLPKNWCFKITESNLPKFKHIRHISGADGYISSKAYGDLSWGYWISDPEGYTEISFELFEKHILSKEAPAPIQDTSGSMKSSEPETIRGYCVRPINCGASNEDVAYVFNQLIGRYPEGTRKSYYHYPEYGTRQCTSGVIEKGYELVSLYEFCKIHGVAPLSVKDPEPLPQYDRPVKRGPIELELIPVKKRPII